MGVPVVADNEGNGCAGLAEPPLPAGSRSSVRAFSGDCGYNGPGSLNETERFPMKKLALVSLLLVAAVTTASAQSGAPAAAGQTVTPAGEEAASASVKAKHDKRVAKKAAKKAAKAEKAASS
jgi:hypothetical protein